MYGIFLDGNLLAKRETLGEVKNTMSALLKQNPWFLYRRTIHIR